MAATKRSANGRQLLLLAALLFGIVTMHTLGHPTGHPTGHSSPSHSAGQSSPSHSTSPSTSHASVSEQAAGQQEMSDGGHAAPARPHLAATSASSPVGTDGMDPLSVCLAVLSALTLLLLLKAGLLRPGGFAVPARPLARLLDGLRPNPPPPRILLSCLSVLRI
ncbi:hypothetical protein [Streptomyces sp. NPDC047525]|uniref:hypothetical protein n=1 Tax=Streptomyces sp. NPDC047525 TaxID=3155264 RepID=UPI0033F15891